MYQKGIVHILPLILVTVLIVGVLTFLVFGRGNLAQSVRQAVFNETPKPASVSLATEYKNPFDSDSQYVNPFSEYKNPFDTLP